VEAVRLSAAVPDDLSGSADVDAAIISALEARQAGLVEATVEGLDQKAWLPEPGQGILALVARHPIAEATALDHLPTRTALRTELALLDALDAGDDAPLGCVAQPSGRWIRLWAAAASEDGTRLVRSDRTGPLDEPEALGAAVAKEMIARGFGLVTAVAG
jgi:hydroxymethylbilane synthase